MKWESKTSKFFFKIYLIKKNFDQFLVFCTRAQKDHSRFEIRNTRFKIRMFLIAQEWSRWSVTGHRFVFVDQPSSRSRSLFIALNFSSILDRNLFRNLFNLLSKNFCTYNWPFCTLSIAFPMIIIRSVISISNSEFSRFQVEHPIFIACG